jgi:predicted MPP superfamily phosphohydrolase
MVLKIVLFLAAILTLTVGAHLLLYKAVTGLFVIKSPGLKAAMFVTLLLLSLSFMASFFLLRWQENSLTVGFYMFAAVWTGIFVNLLLAALLSWIICAAVWLAGTYPDTRLIAAGCICLAILFSAYGFWNAFHPRIKKLEVELANLASPWKDKTIVQLSDIHLGHFYGRQYLNSLVQKVNALDPELIFITGDLFDGMAGNISHFAEGLSRFKTRKGVYFITGNHENYIGLDRALNVLAQTTINVIQDQLIDIDGLQIIGIGYPGLKGASQIQGLEKTGPKVAGRKPRILLFHTPTNISPQEGDGLDRHFSTYWVPDTNFSAAQKLAVDLQLSGHTHAGQIFPFGYLTKLLYKGFDHGIRRLGGFAIYTTSGVGTWGPPMRTGNSPEIVVINLI